MSLRDEFGEIDVYLFDQLLKDRITPAMRVLDAGCGAGRNLVYLAGHGADVYGVDTDPEAMAAAARRAASLAPVSGGRFRAEPIERMSFDDASFDAVLCVAVLHFARDDGHFHRMLDGLWRVLKPAGLLFARLASSIGLEDRIESLGGRRYHLPDGTDRFLVDEAYLLAATRRLGGRLEEPIKTVNVQGQRCMTTWCVRKM